MQACYVVLITVKVRMLMDTPTRMMWREIKRTHGDGAKRGWLLTSSFRFYLVLNLSLILSKPDCFM